MQERVPRSQLTWTGQALTAGAMAGLAWLGWATASDHHHPVWWPAAGLAMALWRPGQRRFLPALGVGSVLGLAAAAVGLGIDPVLAGSEALGDLAGGWAGAEAHRRLDDPRPGAVRRTWVGLLAVALVALAGTVVSLLPHLLRDPSGFASDVAQRYLARVAGVVVLAPLVLAQDRAGWDAARRRDAALLGLALFGVTLAAFSVPAEGTQVALVFALFLPLAAAGLRLPAPAPAAGVALVATAAVVASRLDSGLFGPAGMEPALQVFVVFAALTTQLVGAVTADQKAAFAALAESEQRFRLMTENGRDLVALHGLDGAFRWVSGSARAILGREPEALLGLPLHSFIHPGDVLAVEQQLERVADGQGPAVLRFRFRRPDGPWAHLEMTVERSTDAEGRPALRSATRDVSDRVRDLERLRLACQSAGIAVFSWDPQAGRLLDEGRLAELYGVDLARQADPLQAMLACLHPEDRAPAARAMAEALDGTASYRTRFRVLHPTLGERHLFACGEVERDPSGRALLMLGLNWDVTEQVRVEDQLRQARDQAEHAVQAKASFLAMMSHEIRTPLNGIIGMTDALLPEVDRGNRHAVETIRRSGEVLLKVLNDILDFSKIEAGKLVLERQACDVEQVLGDLGSLYASLTREKGLFLKVQPGATPARLVCDPLRLRQVLGNLVSNAVKFTTEGGVSVSCRRHDPTGRFPRGALALEVSDTGIGIPEGKLDRLFQEFSQVDASTTRRYGGTGLGLAISRRLVEAMEGTIEVRSEAGRGSTFTVQLPLPTEAELAEALVAEPDGEVPVLDVSALRGARVLLAEDNAINRRVAVALLGKMGVQVEAVADGRQAVEAWAKEPWDALVMDVQMPELDGLEATRAIRAQEAARSLGPVPILAMTANAFAEDRRACLEAGMNEVVTKPVTRATLQSALARVLARGGAARQRASA